MDYPIFISVLFILQFICFYYGRKYSKNIQTNEDYFLANKELRFFPLLMTFLATQVGGGLVLGSAEEAYTYGWIVLCYPMGAALGLLALAGGIGKRLAKLPVSTVAQIFEVYYGSKTLKKIASSLSILSLFMIFVAQIIASQKFMLSLGAINPIWFFGFWGIVIVYTSLGGMRAVVATDIIQAAFFITVFVFCFAWVVLKGDVSPATIVQNMTANENFSPASGKFLGWLLMPLLFMVIEQDMAQRCFAGKTPKIVSRAALFAAIGTIGITIIPVFFGVLAKEMGLVVPQGVSVLIYTIMQTSTPAITAIVSCAIIVAIVSTADSLINAVSSNISQDFIPQNKSIRFSQVLSGMIAVLGIICSFYFDNIVDLLIQSYELSVSCLLVPVTLALFLKRNTFWPAAGAILFGAFSFFFFRVYPMSLPKEIVSIALSLAGFGLGMLCQQRAAEDNLIPRDTSET